MERDMETIKKDVMCVFEQLESESPIVFEWSKTNISEYRDAVNQTIMNCYRHQNEYDPFGEAVYVLHFFGCILSDDIDFGNESETV